MAQVNYKDLEELADRPGLRNNIRYRPCKLHVVSLYKDTYGDNVVILAAIGLVSIGKKRKVLLQPFQRPRPFSCQKVYWN